MMEGFLEVCRAFALTVSAKKTAETMCMPPPRTYTGDDSANRSNRANLQIGAILHLFIGGAVTETPDMSVEFTRRTRAC